MSIIDLKGKNQSKMEMEDLKMMSSCQDDNKEEVVVDEEPENRLPGFRFHPTDEELVSFYLKRKVEKKPIRIEIIKQIDIYKHDPWELTKTSSIGDKEWYFYCKRERKYRNSVRPNRVTGSGFWKATGIDKPIYSNGGDVHQSRCVGLKKSLVYYRGNAGKGSKTDWMMHEFRLPTDQQQQQQHSFVGSNPSRDALQEAEVWTLCRIFRRSRKYTPDWRQVSAKRFATTSATNDTTKTCSAESINNHQCYISFADATIQQQQQHYFEPKTELVKSSDYARQVSMTHTSASESSPLNPTSSVDVQDGQFLTAYDGNWDDLSSVVEFAVRSPLV